MTEKLNKIPQYKCRKIVGALKIMNIEFDEERKSGAVIEPEAPFEAFMVSQEYVNKYKPKIGGYYILDEDKYESFSSPVSFERDYTLISEPEKEFDEVKTDLKSKNEEKDLEPTFTLRAKDLYSLDTLISYKGEVEDTVTPECLNKLDNIIKNFVEWREKNQELLIIPD